MPLASELCISGAGSGSAVSTTRASSGTSRSSSAVSLADRHLAHLLQPSKQGDASGFDWRYRRARCGCLSDPVRPVADAALAVASEPVQAVCDCAVPVLLFRERRAKVRGGGLIIDIRVRQFVGDSPSTRRSLAWPSGGTSVQFLGHGPRSAQVHRVEPNPVRAVWHRGKCRGLGPCANTRTLASLCERLRRGSGG